MRRFFPPSLVLLCLLGAYPVRGDGETLAVNILSKHVRLVREGKSEMIRFDFIGKHAFLHSGGGGQGSTGFLKIFLRDGRWILEHDEGFSEGSFDITVPREQGAPLFHVKIRGETRAYPLPLLVRCRGGDPEIIIREDADRYAMDAASAEYGALAPGEEEAGKALSAVIRARVFYLSGKKRHDGFDFCDLTHCQVYRGRLSRPGDSRGPGDWAVDWKNLGHDLLFHSRCGGATFGPGIFGTGKWDWHGVKDRLYREGVDLCTGRESRWEARIHARELAAIMDGDNQPRRKEGVSVRYDNDRSVVTIYGEGKTNALSPENFRLSINRVKGWNFIKSNNYTVRSEEDNKGALFIFSGSGLGHGVGMCQHGALELSRRGYSWGEILYHYFPEIGMVRTGDSLEGSPEYSSCTFSLANGAIERCSPAGLPERRLPPGSLWKVIVALYLSTERQDLFNDYRYDCTGHRGGDKNLPERCWKLKGHGSIGLEDALAGSCNLYFASLYEKIDLQKFKKFYQRFCKMLDIENTFPEMSSSGEFSALLAGMDFRMSFAVRDFIKIAGIVGADGANGSEDRTGRSRFPVRDRARLMRGLMKSFTAGTARFPSDESGKMKKRYAADFPPPFFEKLKTVLDGIWGKTSTVVAGTNVPISYGIFIGGYRDKGVLVILRNGTGHLAAQWGKLLLMREYSLF